jgi:hypothetical protein
MIHATRGSNLHAALGLNTMRDLGAVSQIQLQPLDPN